MSKTAEQRGVKAWGQYAEDMKAWREKYVRLAEKYAAALRTYRERKN